MGPGRAPGPAGADLLLTDEVGRRVATAGGDRSGRVTDLTVRLRPDRPPVLRVLVRAGDVTALVPRDVVEQDRPLDLAAWGVDAHHLPLARDELLLARDVLDTQVVDLRGRRLSRVSDVLLRRDAGGGLEVVGVDLGTAGLLRRLGLGFVGRGVLALEWQHLHLTSPRGHLVQLDADAAPFRRLDPRGLAELLTRLSTPRALDVVRAVEPAHAAAALHQSHPRTGRRIVAGLSHAEQEGLVVEAADEHARTVRRLGRGGSPVARRRFRRTEGWRLHRPPGGGR
ncbi:hypothetical protein ASG76_04520 [Nocardioides sp. Soil774]|uniref:hypothetical protein n=1 Tax=Nocardioides sp. Soil774 TaxID=1736408 RepID=UPI0006F286AE|nr:hypothetical protein [Nocardioides sp. Soil774]KRE96297.1 hypothetical protein ASG76_04520 [Nocardioides sp. Soil774]